MTTYAKVINANVSYWIGSGPPGPVRDWLL